MTDAGSQTNLKKRGPSGYRFSPYKDPNAVIDKKLVGTTANGEPYHFDFYFGNTVCGYINLTIIIPDPNF